MSESARISELLDLIASRGLQVSVIRVGDVQLALSSPWPKSELATQADVVREDRGQDPKLEALRAKGLREFGKRMPDDVLRSLEPVL